MTKAYKISAEEQLWLLVSGSINVSKETSTGNMFEQNPPVPLSRIEEQLDMSPHVDRGKKSVVHIKITFSMMKLQTKYIPQRHFFSPLH